MLYSPNTGGSAQQPITAPHQTNSIVITVLRSTRKAWVLLLMIRVAVDLESGDAGDDNVLIRHVMLAFRVRNRSVPIRPSILKIYKSPI